MAFPHQGLYSLCAGDIHHVVVIAGKADRPSAEHFPRRLYAAHARRISDIPRSEAGWKRPLLPSRLLTLKPTPSAVAWTVRRVSSASIQFLNAAIEKLNSHVPCQTKLIANDIVKVSTQSFYGPCVITLNPFTPDKELCFCFYYYLCSSRIEIDYNTHSVSLKS